MIRGKGYRPDPAGHRRTALRSSRLSVTSLPPQASIEQFAPPVMDQDQTGSCTGHATACAIYTALAAAGMSLLWVPSPAGIYTLGRCIDRLDPSQPLTDNGAQPNQVMRGISEWGIRPMKPLADRYSDADVATINAEPALGDLVEDARTLVIGEYSVSTADDVCLALANKIPVTFAIEADTDAFQNYAIGVLGPQGTALDHYVCFLGYETLSTGDRVFRMRNSWSAAWGMSGDALLSELALEQLGDMVAMKVSLR